MLSHYQYGHMPPKPDHAEYGQKQPTVVFGGLGLRTELFATVSGNGHSIRLRADVVTPCGEGPFPVIVKNDRVLFLAGDNRGASGFSEPIRRGIRYDEEILPKALRSGYAMCKFVRTDLAADVRDNRSTGIFPLYPEFDWGTIGAWAWGYGLVIDILAAMPVIDSGKIVATGHSRGGKAALCASIFDERIALAAPNSSGTGGTGGLRHFEPNREPHQTLEKHIGIHDHWWGPRFLQFAGQERKLPFDAHTAKALIAPRSFVNPHVLRDSWANPYGTELTHRAAARVFEWLGCAQGIGIHWREGGHAQGTEDWMALLDFADFIFRGKQPERTFDDFVYPNASVPVDWKVPTSS